MTRPIKAAVAAILLAFVFSLLVPTLAMAADAPWVGTYKGVGVGKDAKGKKGTSGVTIWVEDLGDSTKFTFRFDRFPVIISKTAPNDGGTRGSMLMGISVEERGVSGAGLIVVYPRGGNYMMAGKGAGKALGKQGTGRLGAVRTSTGVVLPSMTDQIKDLFTALLNRKVKSRTGGTSGGTSDLDPTAPTILSDDGVVQVADASNTVGGAAAGTKDDPDVVVGQAPHVAFVKAVAVEPASIVDLAKAKPPVTTQTAYTATALLLILTSVAAIISVGPKLRRTAATAGAATMAGAATADQPDTSVEGS